MRPKRNNIEGGFVPIPYEMLDHPAFRKLSETALRVLMHSIRKSNRKSVDRYDVIFNITYPEAKKRLSLSDSTFRNAMLQLHSFGFINYYNPGGSGMNGQKKIAKGYRLSKRWKAWGTAHFETRHEGQFEIANE